MDFRRLVGIGAAATLLVAAPVYGQGPDAAGYGADPVTADAAAPQTPGALGDQQRHYHFEEAGVEMPYRLFVPESYDPDVPTPLVVALHGFTGSQNYFFSLTDDLPGQLEAHGFIFVAPMGYNRGSWYGMGGPSEFGGDVNTADIMVNGHSVTELGELDVLHVMDIVRSEYNIDPDRTYLMGHSMGGAATWYLGGKYASTWAAIAPMSGTGLFSAGMDDLTDFPVMVAVGGEEDTQLEPSKEAVDKINAAGGSAEYLEIEGAGHVPMIRPATPQILDFFAQYKRAR